MKIHGIQLQEGTAVKNMTVDSGVTFPTQPDIGELFFLTGGIDGDPGLYVFTGAVWATLDKNTAVLQNHAATHLPNGADALTTGTAVSLSPVSVNGPGISNALARADHSHELIGIQATTPELTSLISQPSYGLAARVSDGVWATRSLIEPATGISITNADGVLGNPTFSLANDLLALESLASTGIAVRTGNNSWAQRTIAGSDGIVTVSNGDGVLGNPTVSLSATGIAPGEYVSVGVDTYGRAVSGSTTQPWNTITSTPTTVAGYGISDAVAHAELLAVSRDQKDAPGTVGIVNGRADTVVSFNDNTRTFTVSPATTSFKYYVGGSRYEHTQPLSVTIDNIDGLWFIYFDGAGGLTCSLSPWDLFSTAPIAIVYWNATLGAAQFIGEERHGSIMDPATHHYMHTTEGTKYRSGLSLFNQVLNGDGSSDSHAQMAVTDGIIQDEDIVISIKHSDTPTALFEQTLRSVGRFPVLYRLGQSWVREAPTVFPLKVQSQQVVFNNKNGVSGLWELQQSVDNQFVCMFLMATNIHTDPVVAIMGQRADIDLDSAKNNNDFAALDWGTIPFTEFKGLYRLIFQTNSAYGNSAKARLVAVDDLRNTASVTISAIPTVSHADLTGLANDDHPQYIHALSNRTIRAQHVFAPTTVRAPFTLGANAQGQLVGGLNAQQLSGKTAADFQAYSAVLDKASQLTGTGFIKRLADNSWSANALLISDIPNLSWTKITADKPTTLSGYGISDAQPLSADLTAITAVSGTGFLVKTGVDSWSARSIGSATLTVNNGNGVAGSTSINLANIGTPAAYARVTTDAYGRVVGGVPPTGLAGQQVATVISAATTTSTIAFDNGAPTSTEGALLTSITITPTSANSTFMGVIAVTVDTGSSLSRNVAITIFRGTTLVGMGATNIAINGRPQGLSVTFFDAPATTSDVTYNVRIGQNASGTTYINTTDSASFGNAAKSAFIVSETL